MNAVGKIAPLFDNDITRQIEEVIKVDQTSAEIIASEIDEYVVTDAIKKHFVHVLERYQETPQKPHEGVAIWISGFFGSGKSSFAEVLGLAIEDRNILGTPAAKRFAARANDAKLNVVLNAINEKNPDPHGHLRRLHRPRDPVGQSDAD
jgi:2-phosphoglycerate kinase